MKDSYDSLFNITISDIQQEAVQYLGRNLNEEEIQIAKKGLESGLMTGIEIVYKTIFNEMINKEM